MWDAQHGLQTQATPQTNVSQVHIDVKNIMPLPLRHSNGLPCPEARPHTFET